MFVTRLDGPEDSDPIERPNPEFKSISFPGGVAEQKENAEKERKRAPSTTSAGDTEPLTEEQVLRAAAAEPRSVHTQSHRTGCARQGNFCRFALQRSATRTIGQKMRAAPPIQRGSIPKAPDSFLST